MEEKNFEKRLRAFTVSYKIRAKKFVDYCQYEMRYFLLFKVYNIVNSNTFAHSLLRKIIIISVKNASKSWRTAAVASLKRLKNFHSFFFLYEIEYNFSNIICKIHKVFYDLRQSFMTTLLQRSCRLPSAK